MQGLREFIPTDQKVAYINKLLGVGFHSIDFGSFVSAKAIPQMRDTREVLERLDLGATRTKLLAIVANERGAGEAALHPEISYLGYPFSISETFQLRNTNATIAESVERVKAVQDICLSKGKELVIYISMGFGNPYGDVWNVDIVQHWVDTLAKLGITIFALSDTIGVSNPRTIEYLFKKLVPEYPQLVIGAHLHTEPTNWREKIEAAYMSGCRRFDSAMRGFGGCPMAKDDLTGNMATEHVISYFSDKPEKPGIDFERFNEALVMCGEVFPH